MLLANLHIMGKAGPHEISVEKDIIAKISPLNKRKRSEKTSIYFDEAIAFPGLINSHDHLDFNLFPQLGNGIYPSYIEWAADIHERNKEVIGKINSIPELLRAKWGMYKNLLNGVTTVVNHGKQLRLENDFIRVLQAAHSLHSLAGEKNWKWKVLNPFNRNQPIVLHIGEGTNNNAKSEIKRFKRWNLNKKKIIAVHGVGMNSEDAAAFEALVWCPASNLFMLGQTADIKKIKRSTDILFGTDSTLTAEWSLWRHLRLARELQMLTDEELFQSMTTTAASTWNLGSLGKLEEEFGADLVIAKKSQGLTGWDAFYAVNPEDILLSLCKGEIILFDEILQQQLTDAGVSMKSYSPISLNGSIKFVIGNLPALLSAIRKYDAAVSIPVGDIVIK